MNNVKDPRKAQELAVQMLPLADLQQRCGCDWPHLL